MLIAVLVFSVIAIAAVIVGNASERVRSWSFDTGPDQLGTVRALALDERSGRLYAATPDGVFVSTSGGANWHICSCFSETYYYSPVLSLALDERDNTLYAGTQAEGVLVSTDGGETWAETGLSAYSDYEILPELERIPIVSALSPGLQQGTVYAATLGGGVFRSASSGVLWDEANTGLTSTIVWALALDEQTEALYAGTEAGVFRSINEGRDWEPASTGLTNNIVRALVIDRHGGMLYAGTDDGVFRSSSGGDNWEIASAGMEDAAVKSLLLDAQRGVLFASSAGGLFRSIDEGMTWEKAGSGPANGIVYALAQDMRTQTLTAGTSTGTLRSTDGGETWQPTSGTLLEAMVSTALPVSGGKRLYAATAGGGILRSSDGGESWQLPGSDLADTAVFALVLGRLGETLYAGTDRGVVRSTNGGTSWQASIGPEAEFLVWSLVLDDGADILSEQDDTVFAGTFGGGIFRSSDGGKNWQAAGSGLTSSSVPALLLDSIHDTLYAGTQGGGIFRSTDGGESWQPAGIELADTTILALARDERDSMLYAGTWGKGIFRSPDRGNTWQPVNSGLPNRATVRSLVLDPWDGTLFAGTETGVYLSSDQGDSWQRASMGLTDTSIRSLAFGMLDSRRSVLYASTESGLFRTVDGAENWKPANGDLRDQYEWTGTLALDVDSDTLYAGASGGRTRLFTSGQVVKAIEGGLFKSTDYGVNWQPVNDMPGDTHVQGLASGTPAGAIHAASPTSMSYSADGGSTWKMVPGAPQAHALIDLLSTRDAYGVVERGPDDSLVWAAHDGGAFWARFVARLGLTQSVLQPLESGEAMLFTPWQGDLARHRLASGYTRLPLALLSLRALIWRGTTWLGAHSPRLPATVLWILLWATPLILFLRWVYRVRVRPLSDSEEDLWRKWDVMVRAELLCYGNVEPNDLWRIPHRYRRDALQHYLDTYESDQRLDGDSNHLRLLTTEHVQTWRAACRIAGEESGEHGGFTPDGTAALDQLAFVLTDALGFASSTPRTFEATRAYPVRPLALRVRIPSSFPLVFVAEPNPTTRTVDMLVDVVDVMEETGYFMLVVPIELPGSRGDTASELRRSVENSPHAHDFVILSLDDVLDILVALHPGKALVECLLKQVNLAALSPFVDSGPVPERSFFGRKEEIRKLEDNVHSTNFAVVGNRRIGKTSLLHRVQERLASEGRARVLLVDCNPVRDAEGFYAAFQAAARLASRPHTPGEFEAAVTRLCQDSGPLVLLIDEVDAVLAEQRLHDDSLVRMWGKLGQVGTCHFVLCGGTELALALSDRKSRLFNFPSRIPLGYLKPDEACLVLTQPLDTLGVTLENREEFLDKVLDITSGHPNLVQFLGRRLVEEISRRKERRIQREDLDVLLASAEFGDRYLETVWGAAEVLERIVTIVAPAEGFDKREIEERLASHGIRATYREVDMALELLQVRSILERNKGIYGFVPQAFPEVLRRTLDTERQIAQELQILQEQRS